MPANDTSNDSPDSVDHNGDTTAAEAALEARLSRKRTKTGCLTCRKRRIKCGEERPMCRNCIKSRRHCEGYIQRVVFKPSTFDNRSTSNSTPMTSFQHLAGPVPSMMYHSGSTVSYPIEQQAAFSPIHPRPFGHPEGAPSFVHANHFWPQPHLSQQPDTQLPYHQAAYLQSHGQIPLHLRQQQPGSQFSAHQAIQSHPMQSPVVSGPTALDLHFHSFTSQPSDHFGQVSGYGPLATSLPCSVTTTHSVSPSIAPFHPVIPLMPAAFLGSQSVYHEQTGQPSMPQSKGLAMRPPPTTQASPSVRSETRSIGSITADFHHPNYVPDSGPTQMLREAAVETQDDDYYDVESDDGMDVGDALRYEYGSQQHMEIVAAAQQFSASQGMQLRSYDAFLSHGMLDTYRPERVASPLRNEATARVFLHFVSATGPSLSAFERKPGSSATTFGVRETPLRQRGIWTSTMPMVALHNQGLLHAMLALASLHIARLQGGSITPSIQHYAWSLKRIHSAVANSKKRLQLTTIAASMLLGFYEIMTAEHSKWNTHLAGAKQLILETDFTGMMRQFVAMKQERLTRMQQGVAPVSMPPSPRNVEDDALDQIDIVDEAAISRFFGHEVRYGQQGYVEAWTGSIPRLDLSKLEILKDLFWWYCKQDAYQSIISGNPLLMDYSRWSVCPPRAPMGRSDAVYGSFDHLTLLLGRVANFAAKDRVRKLKVMEQNGGQWRPHPASQMAQSKPPPGPGPAKMPTPAGPIFYGMAPAPSDKVRMPSSYERLDGQSSPTQEQESWSMDVALQEYNNIRAALQEFKMSLSDAYAPLSEDCQAPTPTSFGPALFYRSYDIGCMMAIWNMTVIIVIRSHPYFHPAAHAAAAMAAEETTPYAMEIGRIAAGIVPGPQNAPLNPFLGAALVESCMPCFFAAVQYQSSGQRYETVTRMFNTARRTGWGTADLIANGCETAWVKAAQAGRGPPYTRIARSSIDDSTDSRMNGSWEHQDPSAQPDENDQVDRRFIKEKAVARLHWAIGIMGTEHDI